MAFSAYLVGTWERRFGILSNFQVINPTVEPLYVLAAFFDKDGTFLLCLRQALGANQLWDIVLPELDTPSLIGVAKFISHDEAGELVKPGIVGFQRHALAIPEAAEVAFSEAPLNAVPAIWYPTALPIDNLPIEWKNYPQEEFAVINPLC